MIDALLAMMLQAAPQVTPPAPSATPPAQVAEVKEEEPKQICSWEPVTGTRAKKQWVCKTPGYLKGGERTRDMIGGLYGANVQPKEPAGPGSRPGGPGY